VTRILLVRLRRIGDVVFTTPAVRAVRSRFPDSHITYLVEPPAAPVVQRHPHIDEVIVAPMARGLSRLAVEWALIRRLRAGRFDLAIDFHGGPRASLLTWLSGAPRRIGYNVVARGWMYTDRVERPRGLRPRHSVENQWDLLDRLGIARPDPDRCPTEMASDPEADAAVDRWLREAGVGSSDRLIVVHVGAGGRFRRWPLDRFADAIASLARRNPRLRFILMAGPDDDSAVKVAERIRTDTADAAAALLEVRPWTLAEVRAMAARASVYVGCDTGPLHVAATTPTPVVALYGPTLPATWGPWRPQHRRTVAIEVDGLPCRPCDQRVCAPGDFRCLTRIEPAAVVEAVERLTSSTADAAIRVRSGAGSAPAVRFHHD
jgi:lipopolysaccharide heptosyltransferase II